MVRDEGVHLGFARPISMSAYKLSSFCIHKDPLRVKNRISERICRLAFCCVVTKYSTVCKL